MDVAGARAEGSFQGLCTCNMCQVETLAWQAYLVEAPKSEDLSNPCCDWYLYLGDLLYRHS